MKKGTIVLGVITLVCMSMLVFPVFGEVKVLHWNLGTEPPTLDPALATDTTSVFVDEQLFLGLTDFNDETMEVIPELAIHWRASDDGLVWTFVMRDDIKWTNGKPVTAYDVEYGVKRTLDPATASNYAYMLYVIKGAEDFNAGEVTDSDTVGVKAVDDYTVRFELNHPAGYFPSIAGMWIARPQPQETIEKWGDKWTEPENIVTNGHYMLKEWVHDDYLVMVKNPDCYEADKVQIDEIYCVMIEEQSTALALYEGGELNA
ncbi:peptide ABC transporter substrate-binding protein, partial [Candidatus Aerophobetes bacterium]|nr:peptide ABC transporter substrate-binding protein [Candidatus Aerophobetes bacterium]